MDKVVWGTYIPMVKYVHTFGHRFGAPTGYTQGTYICEGAQGVARFCPARNFLTLTRFLKETLLLILENSEYSKEVGSMSRIKN